MHKISHKTLIKNNNRKDPKIKTILLNYYCMQNVKHYSGDGIS